MEIKAEAEGDGVLLLVNTVETIPYISFPAFLISDEGGVSAGVGIKSVNLFGRGVQLSTAVRFGGGKNIDFLLASPWRPRTPFWYQVDFWQRDRANGLDHYKENASELESGFGWQATDTVRLGGCIQFHLAGKR
ncbi:MAG: hypothetical protein JJE04_24595, partial [Acidobacteriia bacterium]|nr:hypothetical protein [Terriglobia bacterium]